MNLKKTLAGGKSVMIPAAWNCFHNLETIIQASANHQVAFIELGTLKSSPSLSSQNHHLSDSDNNLF